MIARLHHASHLFVHQNRADRKSVGQRLRDGEHIRFDADLFVREERAGASQATLNLVENKQHVPLPRELAQTAQEFGVDHAHAAFTLNGLDDHRRRLLGVQSLGEFVEVALHNCHTAHQRPEWQSIRWTIGRRERAGHAAVECPAHRDDVVLVGESMRSPPPARELEGAFVRLGTRVREEHAAGERVIHEPLRQRLTRRRAIEVRRMNEPCRHRFPQRVHHARIVVPQRRHRDTGHEVQILFAVLVEHVNAISANEQRCLSLVRAENGRHRRRHRRRCGGRGGRERCGRCG